MIYPLDTNIYQITAKYDSFNMNYWEYNGGYHKALDIGAPIGTPIKAIADGKVIASYGDQNSGRGVHILHSDGWSSVYFHNSENLVSVGQNVKEGDVIAKVGNSGFVTGPHVHFAIEHPTTKELIDPITYIENHNKKTIMNNNENILTVQSGDGISHLAKRAGYADFANEDRWNYIAKLNGHAHWSSFKLYAGMQVRIREDVISIPQIINEDSKINPELENIKLENQKLLNELEIIKNQSSEEKNSLQNQLLELQNKINDLSIKKELKTSTEANNSDIVEVVKIDPKQEPKLTFEKLELNDFQIKLLKEALEDIQDEKWYVKAVQYWQSLPVYIKNSLTVFLSIGISFLLMWLPTQTIPDLDVMGATITGSAILSALIGGLRFVFDKVNMK